MALTYLQNWDSTKAMKLISVYEFQSYFLWDKIKYIEYDHQL